MFKQILAITLAATMVIGFVIPVVAADNGASKFEELIKLSKKAFNIGNDFDDIKTEMRNGTYNITWGYKDKKKDGGFRVTFNKDGYLKEFYKYSYKGENKKSVIKKDDAEKLALKTLNTLLPNKKYDFYIKNTESDASRHRVIIGTKVKNIPVYGSFIEVTINKSDGKIENIYLSELALASNYIDASKVKQMENGDEAYEKMLEKNPLYLFLQKNISKEEGKLYPYYIFIENSPIIDATTFELLDFNLPDGYGMGSKDMKVNKAEESSLSVEEVKEIDKVKSLKTKEQAAKKAAEFFEFKNNGIKSFNLFKNYATENYSYDLQFEAAKNEYISASVRADNLMPLSFSRSVYKQGEEPKKIDAKKANKILDEFNKKIKLDYDKLYESENETSVSRQYFKRLNEYYLKDEMYFMSANDKYLTYYRLLYTDIDDSEIKFEEKKIEQEKAENEVKAKGNWSQFVFLDTKRSEKDNELKIKEIKNVYAFEKEITDYDAITGSFFDMNNPGPIYKPTGEVPEKLVDIIDAGFGVGSEKSFDDYMDYRDLYLNIYKLNNGYVPDIDEVLKRLNVLDPNKKINIDLEIEAGEIYRVYLKDKLDLKDELDNKYFQNSSDKERFTAYMQLARAMNIVDKNFKSGEKIKVKDALTIFSKIYFK